MCRASQRANSTFCWLPPESVPTVASMPVPRTSRRSKRLRTRRASLARRTKPARSCWSSVDSVMFSRIERSSSSPSSLRLSGTIAMPCADRLARAAHGDRLAVEEDLAGVAPVGAEEQAGGLGAPGADEAGEPDDLARAHVRARRRARRRRGAGPVASSTTGASVDAAFGGYVRSTSRPTIAATSVCGVSTEAGPVRTTRASRITVTVSDDGEHLVEVVGDEHDRRALARRGGGSRSAAGRSRPRSARRSARPSRSSARPRASARRISTFCWSATRRPPTIGVRRESEADPLVERPVGTSVAPPGRPCRPVAARRRGTRSPRPCPGGRGRSPARSGRCHSRARRAAPRSAPARRRRGSRPRSAGGRRRSPWQASTCRRRSRRRGRARRRGRRRRTRRGARERRRSSSRRREPRRGGRPSGRPPRSSGASDRFWVGSHLRQPRSE